MHKFTSLIPLLPGNEDDSIALLVLLKPASLFYLVRPGPYILNEDALSDVCIMCVF